MAVKYFDVTKETIKISFTRLGCIRKQDAHIDTVDVGLSQSVLIYILEFFLWFKYKDYHNTKVRFHLLHNTSLFNFHVKF